MAVVTAVHDSVSYPLTVDYCGGKFIIIWLTILMVPCFSLSNSLWDATRGKRLKFIEPLIYYNSVFRVCIIYYTRLLLDMIMLLLSYSIVNMDLVLKSVMTG